MSNSNLNCGKSEGGYLLCDILVSPNGLSFLSTRSVHGFGHARQFVAKKAPASVGAFFVSEGLTRAYMISYNEPIESANRKEAQMSNNVFDGFSFVSDSGCKAELVTYVNHCIREDVEVRPVEFRLHVEARSLGMIDDAYIAFGSFVDAYKFATRILGARYSRDLPFGASLDFDESAVLCMLRRRLTVLIKAGLCEPTSDEDTHSALVEEYSDFNSRCAEINEKIEWLDGFDLEMAIWHDIFKDQL